MYDNAKAVLIVLVVFGHVIENPLPATRLGSTVLVLMYLFHMPAFAFVSGFFAKPNLPTDKGRRRFLRLLGCLVAFQMLNALVWFVTKADVMANRPFHYAAYTLWWLVALLSWSLVLPLFDGARRPTTAAGLIALAVGASVFSGFVLQDGGVYSLSRTIVFFPFFLAGYYASRFGWVPLRTRVRQATAGCTFIAAAAFLSVGDHEVLLNLAKGRFTYAEMIQHTAMYGETTGAAHGLARLGLTVASALLVVAFLQLVPTREAFYTGLGKSTLSVYLWHAMAITLLGACGLLPILTDQWWKALVLTVTMVAAFGFGPIAAVTVGWMGLRAHEHGKLITATPEVLAPEESA